MEKYPITKQLGKLLADSRDAKKPVDIKAFFKIFNQKATDFQLGRDQDSQEFNKKLEQLLNEEWKYETPLTQEFQFECVEKCVCNPNGHTSTHIIPYTSLELPSNNRASNMSELLKEFFATETIDDENNLYECNGCDKAKVPYKKCNNIGVTPNFLCILLKRFEFELVEDPITKKLHALRGIYFYGIPEQIV